MLKIFYSIFLTDSSIENEDAERFVRESNLSIIQQYVENNIDDPDDPIPNAIDENNSSLITGLGKFTMHYLMFYRFVNLIYNNIFFMNSIVQVRISHR